MNGVNEKIMEVGENTGHMAKPFYIQAIMSKMIRKKQNEFTIGVEK